MTFNDRRIIVKSIMRAQAELLRARFYLSKDGSQTGQEISIDLTDITTALQETVDSIRRDTQL